jgi:hypothetical protein
MKKCSIQNCLNSYYAKGLCALHYKRQRATGNPLGVKPNGPKLRSIENRFWEKVTPGKPDECWLWQGGFHSRGYGQLWHNELQRSIGAHRVSLLIKTGILSETFEVCHTCDNPPCVNPDHLYFGTSQDNAIDRETRLRGRHTKKYRQ